MRTYIFILWLCELSAALPFCLLVIYLLSHINYDKKGHHTFTVGYFFSQEACFPFGNMSTSPTLIRPIRKLKIRNNIQSHGTFFNIWECCKTCLILSQDPFLRDKHINSNNKTTYLGTKSHVYCQHVLKWEKRVFNVRICTFPYWYVLEPCAET